MLAVLSACGLKGFWLYIWLPTPFTAEKHKNNNFPSIFA